MRRRKARPSGAEDAFIQVAHAVVLSPECFLFGAKDFEKKATVCIDSRVDGSMCVCVCVTEAQQLARSFQIQTNRRAQIRNLFIHIIIQAQLFDKSRNLGRGIRVSGV